MYNLSIPNLLNGVSQQPPPVRFPTQCERQVNAYSSPVEGLTKRPPTEHVSKMKDDSDPGYGEGSLGYKFHLIDRGDGQEAYAVLARKAPSASCTACVSIYDLKKNGAPVPVLYAAAAAGYMVGTPQTAYTDIELVSVADYTFVVNRSVKVEMTNATTAASASEGAILWVAGAGYGQTYTVKLKLGAAAEISISYTTQDVSFHSQAQTVDDQVFPDNSSTIDSSYIAAQIKVAMEANATIAAGYDITRNGFAIFIKPKTAEASFTINVSDGESGNDLRVAKDFVNRFEDLPIQAPHNFVMKIGGLPEEDRDDYYVKFVQKSVSTTVPGAGEWEETAQPGILTTIDAETLPHGLIRYFDDNGDPFFVFKPFDGTPYSLNGNPLEGSDISWGTRRVGDTQTNPLPSFVGDRISDIFVFKNRLGFLAGEGVILSETGEYFNFFRTTVTTLLDSDLIDVGSAYPGITLFHSAVPYLDRLILFADKVQMAIQSTGGPLSSRTVSLSVVSNYEYLRAASPAPVNDIIFFAFDRGGSTGIRNMQVSQDDSNILTAPDISAHIPQYIQGKAIYMAASAHDNVLAVLTEAARSKLYIYKWFDNDRQRVQSSWSEWSFEDGEVIGFGWELSTLWIAFLRPEGIFLERMVIQPDRKDLGSEFVTRLDRRSSIVPYLDGGNLWADFPYVADGVVFGGGNFAEFSVNNVSYQSEFDKSPPTTDPGGEVFATVAEFQEDLQGLQSFNAGFDGEVQLPSLSIEAFFHARLSFTVKPGGSVSMTTPLLGIETSTGYVNLSGRTNSLKTYLHTRSAGGVRNYQTYSGKTLQSGVLVSNLTGGWDFLETVGQFQGSASFTNTGDDSIVVEIIFEKAVDLIPDVLIYEGETLVHTLRPGVQDPPLFEEDLGYRLGNSLFRTSSLDREALLAFTPNSLDPNVTYVGDQNTVGTLPPHYAANNRCFFAVQDGGAISLGIYTNGAQTFGDFNFQNPGQIGRLPPSGTPLTGSTKTNYGILSNHIDADFTTPAGNGYYFIRGMAPGDSRPFSFATLDGSSGPFRWLSFAGIDKTVLGSGEIETGYLATVGFSPNKLLLNKGPLNISESITDAMNQAFNPIMDSEGDEAAVVVFYGYDRDTLEEWIGYAVRIVPGDPNGVAARLLSIASTARWGNLGSLYYHTMPTGAILPNTTGGFTWPGYMSQTNLTNLGTYHLNNTLTGTITGGSNAWFGFFARGPYTLIDQSSITSSNPDGHALIAKLDMTTFADTQSVYPARGVHSGYWPDIKFYLMTYNEDALEWQIASKLTSPVPVTPGLGGNNILNGGISSPYAANKSDPTLSYANSGLEWGSGTPGGSIAIPYAVVSGTTDADVYPAWWATEGTETVDDRTGLDNTATIGSGVTSIPVKMFSWSIFTSGAGISATTQAIDFPYGVVYQAGATGEGLGDSGLAGVVYYDEDGFPEVEEITEGTRVRLQYPLDGTRFDLSGVGFWGGVPYTMEYEFSTPYLKSGDNVLTSGRMQVRNMAIEYDKAGYFEVLVHDRETGITRVYEKDLTLGYTHSRYPAAAGIDTPNLTDGSFKFPVLIRNTNCKVTLRNSSVVPARFLSAEIEASYDSRARRI